MGHQKYPPPDFVVEDFSIIHKLIFDYPLAWITAIHGKPCVPMALPLIISPSSTDPLILLGHCHPSNPLTHQNDGILIQLFFQGPHAYIPSSCYDRQPAVSTWNYTMVHVETSLKWSQQPQDHITPLQNRLEPETLSEPKTAKQEDYEQKLMKVLRPFELRVASCYAIIKLSQDKSPEIRERVIRFLMDGDSNQKALAGWMKRMPSNDQGNSDLLTSVKRNDLLPIPKWLSEGDVSAESEEIPRIHSMIRSKLKHWMHEDPSKIWQIFYRLDLPEPKMKEILENQDLDTVLDGWADAIIEREVKRYQTRLKYRPTEPSSDESDAEFL